MKFKLSIATIVLSSLGLVGAIYMVIDRTAKVNEEPQANKKPVKKLQPQKGQQARPPKIIKSHDLSQKIESAPKKDPVTLNDQDKKVIDQIASLTDDELKSELANLKANLDADDIFNRYEKKQIPETELAAAKEAIERFALLNIESTRRKYSAIQPELKDAHYAHRESLNEIKTIMNDF